MLKTDLQVWGLSRIAQEIESVEAIAPTRIDLAGGTLDIYPVYLFFPEALTLNVGIKIYGYTRVKPLKEGLRIVMEDLNKTYMASDVEELERVKELGLIVKAMKALGFRSGFEIRTRSEAPLKSGLGASSTLLITILSALTRYSQEKMLPHELIDLAAQVEAQVLETLTGKQDYISALFGGINAIWFDLRGINVEKMAFQDLIDLLEEHIILAYSGFEHESGNLNWYVVKRLLEKDKEIRSLLKEIYLTSTEVYEALNEKDMEALGYYVKQEWNARKKLSPEHTNKVIEAFTEELDPLVWGYKLCGAAGGGTLIIIAPPEKHERVEELMKKYGFQKLDFKVDSVGLRLRTII